MTDRTILEHTFTVKVKGEIIDLYCDDVWVSSHGNVSSLSRNIRDIMDYDLYKLNEEKNGWWSNLGTDIKKMMR